MNSLTPALSRGEKESHSAGRVRGPSAIRRMCFPPGEWYGLS
ncbi:hypothetical protein Ddep01_01093 [Deinococcus depolymerans]